MKRLMVIATTLAVVMAGVFIGVVWAGTSNTQVSASASVANACAMSAGGDSSLTFGTLDWTVAGPVQPTADINIRCTSGYGWTITDDDGLNESGANALRLKDSGANYIPYTISYTSSGSGTGANQNIVITGTSNNSDYATAPVGSYSDTITFTVNW